MCPGSGVSGCLPVRESEPAFFRGQAAREGRDKATAGLGWNDLDARVPGPPARPCVLC